MDCIEWPKHRNEDGYGVRYYKGKYWKAHRAAWDEQVGPIPDGVRVLHRCDNPACTNVAHLFLGSQGDNVRDMASKGRHGKSTLTNEQCDEIRERRANGEKVHPLAAEYGVYPLSLIHI